MYLPGFEVDNLFSKSQANLNKMGCTFKFIDDLNKDGDFENIHWLNTPGPIYTTFADNCGTGQIEAMNNVSGDDDYHEVVFKQPVNWEELQQTIIAAYVDPFGAYFFDGNLNWNLHNIVDWWYKSGDRINYIIDRYKEELELPEKPHITSWKIGGKEYSGQLFGPSKPIPENYKAWLDFYRSGMKDYLEWYVYKIENKQIINLPPLKFDWTIKEELDTIFKAKLLNKG